MLLTVCATFLDLRKAFDSLDHTILLERLHQLGVSGTELLWFRDYLTDCQQRVKYNDTYSGWKLSCVRFPKVVHWDPFSF